MRPLTPRQREVLLQIQLHLEQTGFPPTRAEIADALGFRSVNAAEDHLKALVRKGMIETCAGMSRGIRLLPPAEAELRAAGHDGPFPGTGTATNAGAATDVLLPVNGRAADPGAWRTAHTVGTAGGNWNDPPPGVPALRGRPPVGASTRSRSRAPAAPRAGTQRTGAGMATAPQADVPGVSLPLIGRVAAGRPLLAVEHVEAVYSLDASLFERRPDYLLRVQGDSMRDAGMLDGDLLAVKATTDAHNGQIVVARLGNDVTVKRLQRDERRRTLALLPENPAYQPITVDPAVEGFQIEGIGVGLIRQRPSRL